MKFLIYGMVLFSILLFAGSMVAPSFADVISPKKQIDLNITPSKISCKQGLVKVFKSTNDIPACVKPTSVDKLVKNGWAKPQDAKMTSNESMKDKKAVGEIKKITTIKQFGEAGRLETTPRTVGYNFVFDACAFEKTVRAPEVIITSDSETKIIKLATRLQANTCQTNSVPIKAADPNSIMGTLSNKGGVTEKITSLEKKIEDLKKKIGEVKKNSAPLLDQEKNAEVEQNMDTQATSLVDLRAQLNEAKADYNRYRFALYATPQTYSQFKNPVVFEGDALQGVTFEMLGYYREVSSMEKPYRYNVPFRACAGENDIRLPQVRAVSDVETKSAKLADKIKASSCQSSVVKIKANDPTKIKFEMGTPDGISSLIANMESEIARLEKTLADSKESLSQLVRGSEKPQNYEEEVSKLTDKIVNLRNQINSKKAQLAMYNFQFYR